MPRPYSRDLRERVVGAVEGGASRRRAVAIGTVVDWVAAWRQEGRLAAKPMGGDHSSRLKEERDCRRQELQKIVHASEQQRPDVAAARAAWIAAQPDLRPGPAGLSR
jgi:transposase